MSATVIGLDVGTTAVRGVAVSPEGDVVDAVSVAHPMDVPRAGWAEQDPDRWAAGSSDALRQLDRGARAEAIGLSGQMHGLVLLDERDRAIRPAMLWNDQRADAEARSIEETIGLDEVVRRTGNRVFAGFTAPKLRWVRRNEPDSYARIARVCLPKDHVRLRLSGGHAGDVADASGTSWFDVAGRSWSEPMLRDLDVERSWLPPVHESHEVTGETEAGVPVVAGAGDQAAAALGVGADRSDGPASVVLGTSGVALATLPSRPREPDGRLHTFCHAAPDTWHSMGVVLSAAGSLRWLRDTCAPDASFDELIDEAATWPPGTDGLVFLPYLSGARVPRADAALRAAFVGLGLQHDRGALVRAVLEGVAFSVRDCVELLRESGASPSVARLSGGGARSDLWAAIVASVLALPVERTRASADGSAYGAAMLAAVGAGWFSDVHAAVDAWVRTTDEIEPRSDWVAAYAEGYSRFTRGSEVVRFSPDIAAGSIPADKE